MDKFFAAMGLLACLLLAVHMAIGPALRQRLAAAWRIGLANAKRRWSQRHQRPKDGASPDPKAAQQEARQAIERARRRSLGGERDGNVIRPRAFDTEHKKPPLH